MATIQDLILKQYDVCYPVNEFKRDSLLLTRVFTPLFEAGFSDFNWIAAGTSSFMVSPVDNDKIVFRITMEDMPRRDDTPFFLASPYEKKFESSSQDKIRLEILLKGKKISDADKVFLFTEMEKVGWATGKIKNVENFWNDVVTIELRDKKGRVKNVPIISDPSALEYLNSARPVSKETEDGEIIKANRNSCSPNYITMQDQAVIYNTIIAGDPRLKELIPRPVSFPTTEIISPNILNAKSRL